MSEAAHTPACKDSHTSAFGGSAPMSAALAQSVEIVHSCICTGSCSCTHIRGSTYTHPSAVTVITCPVKGGVNTWAGGIGLTCQQHRTHGIANLREQCSFVSSNAHTKACLQEQCTHVRNSRQGAVHTLRVACRGVAHKPAAAHTSVHRDQAMLITASATRAPSASTTLTATQPASALDDWHSYAWRLPGWAESLDVDWMKVITRSLSTR